MESCNKKSTGNIIIPPIIILPPPPTIHRPVIPSSCPPQQIPMFIPFHSKCGQQPPQPPPPRKHKPCHCPQPHKPSRPHPPPPQPYHPQPPPPQPYYPQPPPPKPHRGYFPMSTIQKWWAEAGCTNSNKPLEDYNNPRSWWFTLSDPNYIKNDMKDWHKLALQGDAAHYKGCFGRQPPPPPPPPPPRYERRRFEHRGPMSRFEHRGPMSRFEHRGPISPLGPRYRR